MYFKKNLLMTMLLTLGCMSVFISLSAQPDSVSLNSSARQVWKLKAAHDVGDDVSKIFARDYSTADWVNAVVPGTVYASFVKVGLEPDPDYADNIWKADKKKFDQPYWYITTFVVPETFRKEIIRLHFNGLNRKASIYLNGEKIGALDGFMKRGAFDITQVVKSSSKNLLAVLVEPPMHPMANDASPTYVSSGGWDWMPYVPGLNAGITDKVYLSNTGHLTIRDPWIRSNLPTNAKASLTIAVDIHNNSGEQRQAYLQGVINPGAISFTKKVTVPANSTAHVTLDKRLYPQLEINNPKLWWPNGYGDPNLYTCQFSVVDGDKVSDAKNVRFGIRQYQYDTIDHVLHLTINGTKVFVKGGNWGMSDYMLRCRGKEYDTKVRLHKEMNFNMIRNWIGSTTDEEFYDACDRYGIMVWDDFWLNSNPGLPRDVSNFNDNAVEKIKRFRNHPSIAVWCGDNEGWPEPPLDNWLREDVRAFDGNDRYYQSNSHADDLSGSGPWANKDPRYYFTEYPTGAGGNNGWGFRTEIGTAVFTNVESFRKFMPKENWWPRNEMWEKHFFGQWAFNADADGYDRSIEKYGMPKGIEEYCRKAQLVNIETNKAMYEGWQDHLWEDASGIMTWMSNASNPSLIWQTYDYYYDLTGAYWGAKKACEPLHIQWNPVTNAVKVINTTREDRAGLTAEAVVYDLNGKRVDRYSLAGDVTALSNAAVHCFTIPLQPDKLNIALNKPAYVSSAQHGGANAVTDNNDETRWGSEFRNDEWVYVDLEATKSIAGVSLNWEAAYAKKYAIQVSNDAKNWRDVYVARDGREGVQEIFFPEKAEARYVRIYALERGSSWGISLWDLKVYEAGTESKYLTPVHFIRLTLKDRTGKVLSDNFYWRGIDRKDFTTLNTLPKVTVKVVSTVQKTNGTCTIKGQVSNPKSNNAIAFAIRVQAINERTGDQLLPAFVSDSYFTLLPGETKDVEIEFDAALLGNDMPKLQADPYNSPVERK